MSPKEQKEKDAKLIRYLLRCYPRCTAEHTDDHNDFVDDMSDILLARTFRAEIQQVLDLAKTK